MNLEPKLKADRMPMTRDEMIEAATRLSSRLHEIADSLQERSTGNKYEGEIASIQGIADALQLFDEDL